MMTTNKRFWSVLCLASLLAVGAAASHRHGADRGNGASAAAHHDGKELDVNTLKVQYLEIVTPSVDETCAALSEAHGVAFGDPIPEFGNARTADLSDGGMIGVRGPMRATETPVVRPYLLVDDIEAAVKAAEKVGAEIAMPPMEMPGGRGQFSIYILGGIEHGLWQL